MTAGEKTGAGGASADPRGRRIHRSVEVLERSIHRWSEYATETTNRVVQGSMTPGEWVRGWADLWSGVASDVEDFWRACLDRHADEGAKAEQPKAGVG